LQLEGLLQSDVRFPDLVVQKRVLGRRVPHRKRRPLGVERVLQDSSRRFEVVRMRRRRRRRQRREADDVVVGRRPVEVVDVEKLVDVSVLVVLVLRRQLEMLKLVLIVGRVEALLAGTDGCQRPARDARAENISKVWSKIILLKFN